LNDKKFEITVTSLPEKSEDIQSSFILAIIATDIENQSIKVE